MKTTFKILTILGSPHDRNSNTLAFVEDFVDEIANAGLHLEHEIIPLGKKKVEPCKGYWNCTYKRPCPIKDDLEEIKKWASFLPFELSWWRDRNWLKAKSLKQIMAQPVPRDFDIKARLINLKN